MSNFCILKLEVGHFLGEFLLLCVNIFASNFLLMQLNKQNFGQKLVLKLLIGATFWLCISTSATSASKKVPPAAFPVNPLEIKTPDPLSPFPSPTPDEQKKLSVALDELNNQAQAKLNAGDKVGAFEIWDRELRLRRVLGFLPETQALARVGAIAWTENERFQVQVITQRLDAIAPQLKSSNDLPLFKGFGFSFRASASTKIGFGSLYPNFGY